MKRKKGKLPGTIVSLVLCVTLIVSCVAPASALDIGTIIGALIGGSGTSINITQLFTQALNDEINKKSAIDQWVENIQKELNGEDPAAGTEEEKPATITGVDADNAAEFFNLTVNELKNSDAAPSFTKTESASLPLSEVKDLGDKSVYINAMIGAVTNNKELAATMINAVSGSDSLNSAETKYKTGSDMKNIVSVLGQDYVTKITGDDIQNCTIDFYSKHKYTIHIDLKDCYSTDPTTVMRAFDLPDMENNTYMNILKTLGITMGLKYTDCYIECSVDTNGNIKDFTTNYSITPCFKQNDGSMGTYSTLLRFDFKDFVYTTTTVYDSFNWNLRQFGDVDNNHNVNANDARALLRMSASIDSVSESDLKYCDVNNDGKITSADARILLRVSSKLQSMPESTKGVPTAKTAYSRSEADSSKIDDLIILMAAYQDAKDEAEQKALEDAYNNKYNNGTSTETTTAAPETTTKINSTSDKVNDVVDIIGGILGGLINKK